MVKTRVYELARDLGIESKVLLSLAKNAGIDSIKSHQSTLSEEDTITLRKIHSGETVKIAKKESSASKPKTIRRRRKKVESEEVTDEAEPKEEIAAKGDTEQKAEAKPEETVKEKIEEQTQDDNEKLEAKAEPTITTKGTKAETPAEKVIKTVRPKPESGGAKIVKKATAEEIKDLEDGITKRQVGAKEDNRGRRVTGSGLLSNRIGTPRQNQNTGDKPRKSADSDFIAGEVPSERSTEYRRRDTEDRKTANKEVPNTNSAFKQKEKRASSAYTTKALLDRVGGHDVERNSYGGRKRVVYTPGSSKRGSKRKKSSLKTQITTPKAEKRVVRIGDSITVSDLAKQLSIKAIDIIKKLMTEGETVTLNHALDVDTATLLASEYNYEVKSTLQNIEDIIQPKKPALENLQARAPIITVMGHVDHGKTSILDTIRAEDVASGEAGGITQHIGAYTVTHNGKSLTFLDTPGHEAFSAMRARGANITDIAIIVVAADDGVMPQTIEAISHAKSASVPLIIAVNKMDKQNINLDRIYTELSEHGVQSEEWGGEHQFIKCSALKKTGIDDLLEAINLQSEILELQACPDGMAKGSVVEANLSKGRGAVATLVVSEGTLRVGDYIVAGIYQGKVRAMQDHNAKKIDSAGPSTPVEILGLSGVPNAGDKIHVVENEKVAKELVQFHESEIRNKSTATSSAQSLEDLLAKAQADEAFEVPLIIKADAQGSVEAICQSMLKVNTDRVKNKIIHSGAGAITLSDIDLAAASKSCIIAFNIRANSNISRDADNKGVVIKYFSVIYDAIDAVKSIMVGTLPPVLNENVVGHAEVRQPISVPKFGTIAGSMVLDGKIMRNSSCRLLRDGIVVFDGKLSSLRRFKDDVKEVATGYECGISIEDYNDIKQGDVIESYLIEESQAEL